MSSGFLFEIDVGDDGVGELELSLQIQFALDLYRLMPLHFSLTWLSTGDFPVEHYRELIASDEWPLSSDIVVLVTSLVIF